MVLFDGTRLIRQERWDELVAQGMTPDELRERRVYPVHPAFRVIAIGQIPGGKAGGVPWLTAEVATYFKFHEVRDETPRVYTCCIHTNNDAGAQGGGRARILDIYYRLQN